MPEIINCPQCERKLRVPENLLGQAVKCPTCGTTFTATASAAAPPEPAPFAPAPPPMPSSAPPPMPSSGPPPLPPQGELERRYAEMAPPQGEPPPPYRDPGYPGASTSGYGGEDDIESRRRAQRQEARRSVEGPATALMVYGVLAIALQVCSVGVNLTGGMAGPGPGMGRGRGAGGEEAIMVVASLLGGGLGLVLDIIVLVGSQKMKALESYGMSMAACIIAMLPCSGCCILGLPFGIWGLVALNQPGVKDSFRS